MRRDPSINTRGKTIALIPARSGSKRLSNKHLRNLAGKPLIQHTLEAALQASLVDEVLLSTDSQEIADLAHALGVSLSGSTLRPDSLSQDDTPSIDVIRHVIQSIYRERDYEPFSLVLLQATSPLRNAEHIDAAITQFKTLEPSHSLVSVSPSKPLSWQGCLLSDGEFQPYQSTPQTENFILNGAIYIANSEDLLTHNFLELTSHAFVMSAEDSIDIDTEADLALAQIQLQADTTHFMSRLDRGQRLTQVISRGETQHAKP